MVWRRLVTRAWPGDAMSHSAADAEISASEAESLDFVRMGLEVESPSWANGAGVDKARLSLRCCRKDLPEAFATACK